MRLLKSTQDPAVNLLTARVFHRRAARAIVLSGDDILLLYTQKYHDYSLPGGGIDEERVSKLDLSVNCAKKRALLRLKS